MEVTRALPSGPQGSASGSTALGMPEWVLTAVIAALAVGILAAVHSSWALDLTRQWVKWAPSGTGSAGCPRSRPRLAPVLAAAALVAAQPAVGFLALRDGGCLRKPATDDREAAA